MPKNTTGGNKNKKKANKYVNDINNRKLELPNLYQEIGICNKILGSSRFSIKYIDSITNKGVECVGIARRNLKRSRQFVGLDKYVIISKRDYQKNIVDIIHVYNDTETNDLKNNNLIHKNLINNGTNDNIDFNNIDEDYIDDLHNYNSEFNEEKKTINHEKITDEDKNTKIQK